MTPLELQFLRDLRRRGQSPDLAIFITDDWQWAEKIEDIGTMMIRVRNAADMDHDWSALANMFVILWLKMPSAEQLSAFLCALQCARPSRLWYRQNGELNVA